MVKRILVIMVMAAFTMNAVAATAIAACNCADMTQMEMANTDMPCHDMADADQTADQDNTDTAQCLDCGCGHCKVPSPASILGKVSAADMVATSTTHMPGNDVMISNIMFGIDNPPKPIS